MTPLASVFRQSHYFHRTPSLPKTEIICIDVGRTEVEHDLSLIFYQGSQHLKGRPTWNLLVSLTRKGRLHQAPSVSTERTRYYLKLKTHCFLKNPGDGFYQILNTKILLKDVLTELALAVLALGQTGVFYQQVRCRKPGSCKSFHWSYVQLYSRTPGLQMTFVVLDIERNLGS